jgi:ketosteroid isomerase-like protein
MLTLAPIGGGVADSRDMAYTYGSYEIQEGGRTREKGYYAHMWKRDEAGRWKVVVTNFHSEQTP